MQQIFDTVINTLTLIGRGLSLISRTFGAITRTIFGVTKLVAKLTAGIITGLFNGILNLGKVVVNGAKSALGIGGAAATTATRAAGAGAAGSGALRAAGKAGLRFAPGAGAGLDFVSAYQNFKEGDVGGGALAATAGVLNVASIPLPFLEPFALGATGLSVGHDLTKNFNPSPKSPDSNKSAKPKAQTNPVNPKKPSAATLKMPTSASQSAATTTAAAETTSQAQLQTTPAQTQSLQSSLPNIGPAPQAQPNVVMMSSMAGGQPQEPQMTSSGGAASDVPAISSSNPSNFYTLYSQVNYNVVM